MRKLVAPAVLLTVLVTGCSQSFKDTDPAGYEACTMLDKARDKATDTKAAMNMILFDIGAKAVEAETESIRNGVEDSPLISKLSETPAYSIKDSLAQTCRGLGVSVREVTKSP
ncbi:hypothetical protein QF038_000986 [Pseudarthrobacter sp. W1I19]|uniref:hypothetical protein n=1 Tax=Pseudarthrobacter sp. W1I19 TaxID=3042288 RepID=UPI00277ED1B4|nr:hypothetical protein [Pseudarthrobacter sp. W1I19]MDQ0922478.1 hypothetical protein [Pseudarthrobacter sp. W1I19]